MEAAGGKSPSGLSKDVEAVVLALEKRGVVITEHGVEFIGKLSGVSCRGLTPNTP